MSVAALITLITAITGLLGGIAGVLTAWRGHQVVNNEVKPQAQANTDAVLRLAEDAPAPTAAAVKTIINGAVAGSGSQPG